MEDSLLPSPYRDGLVPRRFHCASPGKKRGHFLHRQLEMEKPLSHWQLIYRGCLIRVSDGLYPTIELVTRKSRSGILQPVRSDEFAQLDVSMEPGLARRVEEAEGQ